MGIEKALSDAQNIPVKGVPSHLRDCHYPGANQMGHGVGYLYAHDFPGHYVKQQYLPDELLGRSYYEPTENGVEKRIRESLMKLRGKK